MSRASEWAKNLATIAFEVDGVVIAGVTLDEEMKAPRLKCFPADLDAEAAMEYARWILDTFGEEPK